MKELIQDRERRRYGIALLIVLAGAAFLRFFMLDAVPRGVHIDEAGMGYDAWSMAHYGVDRWLKQHPFYMPNFGRGQSALLCYLVMILIRITNCDISVWVMRLPGIIINLLGMLALTSIVKRYFDRKWSLVAAGLYAVMPYFIMQCRIGLDCNLLVGMLTISVFVTIWATEKENYLRYVLAGVVWGITYYTYALSYVPNTIILMVVMILLFVKNRQRLTKLLAMLLPIVVIALPLLMVIVVNQFELDEIVLWKFTIPRLSAYRGGELSFDFGQMLANVPEVLRSLFLYDQLPYNATKEFGTLYYISMPLVALGFVTNVIDFCRDKGRRISFKYVFLLIFLAYFVFSCMLQGDGVNVNKVNAMFLPQMFFLVYGIHFIVELVQRKSQKIAGIVLGVIGLAYAVFAGCFIKFYFVDYARQNYPMIFFRDEYHELLTQIPEGDLSPVYIDAWGDYYIFYLQNEMLDPYTFQAWDIPRNHIYGQYRLEYSEFLEYNAYYLVRKVDTEQLEKLYAAGVVWSIENESYVLTKTGDELSELVQASQDKNQICIVEFFQTAYLQDAKVAEQLKALGVDESQLTAGTDVLLFEDGELRDAEEGFHISGGGVDCSLGRVMYFAAPNGDYGEYLNGEELYVSTEEASAQMYYRVYTIDKETGLPSAMIGMNW